MFEEISSRSIVMLAGIAFILITSIQTISSLPTPATASHPGFTQGPPSDVFWPSYVAHLSQAQPDRAFGPRQTAFVYRNPGQSQDIGTQVAFTVPRDDRPCGKRDCRKVSDGGDPGSFCILGFLDMNEQWGTANWVSQIKTDQEFTIFAYLEAEVVFKSNDTWNRHAAVNYNEAIAKVHVNSAGVHIEGGEIACQFEKDTAPFWLQAVEDQSCDLSWAEGTEPLSGLVILKYVSS